MGEPKPSPSPTPAPIGKACFHIVGGAGVSSDAAKAHYRKTNEDCFYFLHFLTHSISCACVCFGHTGDRFRIFEFENNSFILVDFARLVRFDDFRAKLASGAVIMKRTPHYSP